ncbi:MAG TPA: L-histidine N(alpha)-methyltransferase [Candidatus Limnocylindrales bacterium]|nr:L-histidine N(alpha)-methyltransferase [Candidatus Limnocylindrales bacterium]
MSSSVTVEIHPSQFPEQVRAQLGESLRARRINHKFHYESVRQAMKWLELHEVYSPSRNDPDCAALYNRSFAAALERILAGRVHLVGLGCGGGQKDARLIAALRSRNIAASYSPVDVSVAMVLVARQTVLEYLGSAECFPLVCDLAIADDLPEYVERRFNTGNAKTRLPESRLFTFFGMIPNFEPQVILPRLAAMVRPRDLLLFSANLAPGKDYAAGVEKIVPLYDNTLTREWLSIFLSDVGVEKEDGQIRFAIEDDAGLKRIAAYFEFSRAREVQVDAERFAFSAGDSIRLFFSYRHTPALIKSLLQENGLSVGGQWITQSEEEGVFLVARKP